MAVKTALRPAVGSWEQSVNRIQRKIVRTYDTWAAQIKRDLRERASKGATSAELSQILDAAIPRLESSLLDVTNSGILAATRIAAGSRFDLPQIQKTATEQIAENTAFVKENLIPHIHETILDPIARGIQGNPSALSDSLVGLRSSSAQYAGGAWVAIFKTQKTLGVMRETERAAQGLQPESVRWVLDPNAAHCHTGKDGFFGCVEMATEYPFWAALPTVPAGQVSCRGNCRCHLEVFRDGKWQRGVYSD